MEDLVAGINAPRPGDIEVTYIKGTISDLSQFREFVDRIGIQKSHCQAHILSSERAISISFTQPGVPTCIKLQAFYYKGLHEQLSSMTRVCILLSAFLYNVEDLRISATRQPRRGENLYNELWLKCMNLFIGVKWFHLDGNSLTGIVRSLQQAHKQHKTVLHGMHKLAAWATP
jgi:hypothetical protein